MKSGIDLILSKINGEKKGIPYITGASCFDKNSILVSRWTSFPSTVSKKGDLLITVKGTVGEMAFNDLGNIHIARQIMAIDIDKRINKFFVFYTLLARKNELITKSAGLIPGISRDKILSFEIALPPKNEQDIIVDQLKRAMRIIDKIEFEKEQLYNITRKVKSKILDSIFGDNSSYKSYYENMGVITDDIEIYDNTRKPINSDERSKRIEAASILYPYYGATGKVGFIDDYIFDGEYVLVGEDGAPFLDSTSTKAYIINGKSWVNNHAHVLKSKTNNKFLMYYLNWFNYFNYVSGTTRLKLTQAMLRKIPFPNMPLEIKEQIVKKIEKAYKVLESIN